MSASEIAPNIHTQQQQQQLARLCVCSEILFRIAFVLLFRLSRVLLDVVVVVVLSPFIIFFRTVVMVVVCMCIRVRTLTFFFLQFFS